MGQDVAALQAGLLQVDKVNVETRLRARAAQRPLPPWWLTGWAAALPCAVLWALVCWRGGGDRTESLPRRSVGVSQAYARVQYLGFNIFTAPGSGADGCFDWLAEPDRRCYLGSKDVAEDIHRRQRIFEQAVESALASEHLDPSTETLKVFLAPEFYWRGARGAYRTFQNSSFSPYLKALHNFMSQERFKHWLFVPGTIVLADTTDVECDSIERPCANISYYNFATLHVGGTNRTFVQFKHVVSTIDFLKLERKEEAQVTEYCKHHMDPKNPKACKWSKLSSERLRQLGFADMELLKDGVASVGGLDVGLDICLDHARGELCGRLGEREVDLQLVVSAGMNVASGPVCTRPGGAVLLADGFARTEFSLNRFGHGREHVAMAVGAPKYDVGIVYGADATTALQQWLWDIIMVTTGTSFGVRYPGVGMMPGGSDVSGPTGLTFKQVAALGEGWREQLSGFYDTASYVEVRRAERALERSMLRPQRGSNASPDAESVQRPLLEPSVDFYGPVALPRGATASGPSKLLASMG